MSKSFLVCRCQSCNGLNFMGSYDAPEDILACNEERIRLTEEGRFPTIETFGDNATMPVWCTCKRNTMLTSRDDDKPVFVEQVLCPEYEVTSDQFYLQDSRSYVGNDVLFWMKGGNGYTTDLRKAEVYSREDALRMHESRPSDIPWPKSYIDQKTRPAVDMQYIKIADALAGTGIELIKLAPPKPIRHRCSGCGAFMSEVNYWAGACGKCGVDSRP